MITATIGKVFLDAFNEEFGTHYDAKSFFLEIFYPLFYDQEKYLMTAGNTPLENPKISWADMISGKKPFETNEQRKQRFDKLMSKFNIGYPTTDNSVGFGSMDVNSTTSGQTSNIQYPFVEDDIYYSWFGAGLGIGTQSGLTILFSNSKILLDIFEGWKLYRKMLNETPKLKGNQVNTWNGQWLAHRYDKTSYNAELPMANFNHAFETTKDGMSIATQSWTKVLIGIARQFSFPKMMGYVYRFDKTNTTIGFIPFNLEHIRRPIELYQKLFGEIEGREAEELWGTREDGFKVCCQKGAIGIEAMRPKDLEQYMTADKGAKLPKYDEKQIISFHTYQIWLLAMLNNEELWEKSLEFAKVLQNFVLQDKTISPKRKNIVESILSTTSKDKFISSLKELLSNDDIDCINDIAKIVLSMPDSNFKLFLTLIGFHYAVIEKQKDLSINN